MRSAELQPCHRHTSAGNEVDLKFVTVECDSATTIRLRTMMLAVAARNSAADPGSGTNVTNKTSSGKFVGKRWGLDRLRSVTMIRPLDVPAMIVPSGAMSMSDKRHRPGEMPQTLIAVGATKQFFPELHALEKN